MMTYSGTEEIMAVTDYDQLKKSSSCYGVHFRDCCLVKQRAVNEKKIPDTLYLDERLSIQCCTKTHWANSLLSINKLYISKR